MAALLLSDCKWVTMSTGSQISQPPLLSSSSAIPPNWLIDWGIFLIELEPTHKNIEFQNLKIEFASTQYYRYSKWLCRWWSTRRDLRWKPFSKFSFRLQRMLKFFFYFLKREEKNGIKVKLGRKWEIEKVEKIESWYIQRNEKEWIKELRDCGDLT